MGFELCHECYCWVDPREGRCPECWHAIDVARPDPASRDLEQVLGRIVARLGEVRVRRKLLPDRGTLYATTTGLLFLPHEPQHVTQMIQPGQTFESLLWLLASIAWSPLHIVSWWNRKAPPRPVQVRVLRPRSLTADDSPRLPAFLMQNPGVFFVSRKSIHGATRRFHVWRIDRRHASPVRIRPDAEKPQFHRRLASLFNSERWDEEAEKRFDCVAPEFREAEAGIL